MNLLKQDERLGRFTSGLYICHTKAMTAPVQYTTRVCIIGSEPSPQSLQ